MTARVFALPDLGEGLTDAELVRWLGSIRSEDVAFKPAPLRYDDSYTDTTDLANLWVELHGARTYLNPNGEAGRCGFVAEQWISAKTETLPVMPGTAVSIAFSPDKAQSCLYVGDNTNQTIYILNRENLHELGRVGHAGRMAGGFHWLHQVGVDSGGDIYTAEVDTGKRLQKFLRYGATGCGGTGFATVGGVVP